MTAATVRRDRRDDAAILAACPDLISIGGFFKAPRPSTDGDRRILYFEASNKACDLQGETIAAKALADSSEYVLKYGLIDIDHYVMLGPKLGIPDYQAYEIGRPLDVKQDGKSTFVKAEIYRGATTMAAEANKFWSSMTDVQPPHRWYPSVAGAVMEKAIAFDPETKSKKAVIKKVRWQGVSLSKTPVNDHVSARQCRLGRLQNVSLVSASTSPRHSKPDTRSVIRILSGSSVRHAQ